MAIGNYQGRARASHLNPNAKGQCDTCGFWFQRSILSSQYQWAGASLLDTGSLVCRSCEDIPQQQYRSIILPADPLPVVDARPSLDAVHASFNLLASSPALASSGYLASAG